MIRPLLPLLSAVVASAFVSSCGDGESSKPVGVATTEDLPGMVLQLEDLPELFDEEKDAMRIIGGAGPPEVPVEAKNFAMFLQYGEEGGAAQRAICSVAALYDTANSATDAFERLRNDYESNDDAEKLNAPNLGDDTVAYQVVADRPILCSFRQGDIRNVEFHHTTIAFLYGNVIGVVNTGSLEGEPALDEIVELANRQLMRIEGELSE